MSSNATPSPHIERLIEALTPLDSEQREAQIQKAALSMDEELALRRGLAKLAATEVSAEAPPPLLRAAHAEDLIGSAHGAYRIVDLIGQGGMGRVYRAERSDGTFRQQLAIKMLHPSLGGASSLLRRFQTEREILGALQHPGIARIVDAGTWSNGAPFLAMEYVDGQPIDAWCRERNASIAQRLRLLRQVCAAVQAAHAALIVHRDLKPANILVDQEGKAHLLDFGIAKVLSGQDFEHTVAHTGDQVRLMTVQYASPEQISAEPITTATDVYALGVVMYELLSGQLPHGNRGPSPDTLRRILEVDPEPLTRVWSRPAIAEDPGQAALHPPGLTPGLGADLDAIVMKALRKRPAERYSSVDALAEDLDRVLDGRPVLARRGNAWYRMRKFLRRHALQVSAAAIASSAILAAGWNWKLERDAATQERDKARAVTSFLTEVFAQAAPDMNLGKVPDAVEMAKRGLARLQGDAALQGEARVELLLTLAQVANGLGDYASGEQAARAALQDGAQGLSGLRALYAQLQAQNEQNQPDAAARSLDEAEQWLPSLAAAERSLWQWRLMHMRASLLQRERKLPEALAANTEVLAIGLSVLGAPDLNAAMRMAPDAALMRDLVDGLHQRCALLVELERHAEAWPACEQAQAYAERVLPTQHPRLLASLIQLAALTGQRGDTEASLAMSQRILAQTRRAYGPTHPHVGVALVNLGVDQRAVGDLAGATESYREALEIMRRTHGDAHPHTLQVLNNLANVYYSQGQYAEALRLHRDVQQHRRASLPAHAPEQQQSAFNVAKCLWRLEQMDAAQAELAALGSLPIESVTQRGAHLLLGLIHLQGNRAEAALLAARAVQANIQPEDTQRTYEAGALWLEARALHALRREPERAAAAALAARNALTQDGSRDLVTAQDIEALAGR